MEQIYMMSADDIKKLADNVGGVYSLSILSDVRPATIYRLIGGDFKPSASSLLKLNMVLQETEFEDSLNTIQRQVDNKRAELLEELNGK